MVYLYITFFLYFAVSFSSNIPLTTTDQNNKKNNITSIIDPDKSFYDIFGIKMESTSGEITKAYRKLSRKYHPDKNPENKKIAEENFVEVNKIYNILIDPQRRSRYDNTLLNNPQNLNKLRETWNTEDTFKYQNKYLGLSELIAKWKKEDRDRKLKKKKKLEKKEKDLGIIQQEEFKKVIDTIGILGIIGVLIYEFYKQFGNHPEALNAIKWQHLWRLGILSWKRKFFR